MKKLRALKKTTYYNPMVQEINNEGLTAMSSTISPLGEEKTCVPLPK